MAIAGCCCRLGVLTVVIDLSWLPVDLRAWDNCSRPGPLRGFYLKLWVCCTVNIDEILSGLLLDYAIVTITSMLSNRHFIHRNLSSVALILKNEIWLKVKAVVGLSSWLSGSVFWILLDTQGIITDQITAGSLEGLHPIDLYDFSPQRHLCWA